MRNNKILAGILSAAMACSALAALPSSVSAEMLVENTFETDFEGWSNLGDLTKLSAGAEAAFESGRGMTVSGRQTAEDGAVSEKGFFLEGGYHYNYSVRVKADTAEHFKLTLTWRYADNSTESAVIAECDAAAGEWQTLSADYRAPKGTVNLTLTLTTGSTNDFCFDDDFTVTGVSPAHGRGTVQAYAAEAGLKDMYANHFRVGTCMPGGVLNNNTITGIILRDFNSVTCENELKPDATLVQSGSSNSNINVSLRSASGIIDFCVKNNIAMRGHTFVWHSQTPSWFFKSDFGSGNWVDTNTMNQRLESYIKNMFAAIEEQYPTLNLYAYDVCNECVADGGSGGPRQAGDNNQQQGTSAWVSVYHGNDFIKQAFTYAKKYRPEGCKLFYNDYNEYEGAKKNGILNILKDLKSAGLIDGMGMQSHITRQYTSLGTYTNALREYAEAVGCVHITELDIDGADPDFYGGIMEAALELPQVEAFVVWGTTDDTSWRRGTNCLLFDGNGGKKAAYNKLAQLLPESDWGNGNNPIVGGVVIKPSEPDEDGCFFHSTFEEGTDRWNSRGSAKVSQNNNEAYQGSGSVYVSGRTDTWNGVARSLSSNPFQPGETFSFGAMVKFTEGEETEELKLTLQYSSGGRDQYEKIAQIPVKKGEWTLLANDSFTIPADASSMLIYVEAPDSKIDFYVDDAYGGIKGAAPLGAAAAETTAPVTTTVPETTTEPETTAPTTEPKPETTSAPATTTVPSTTTVPVTTTIKPAQNPTEKPEATLFGDVDCNGEIDISDAVLLARVIAEDPYAKVTQIGLLNGDVNHTENRDQNDVILILRKIAHLISKF